MPCFCCCIKEVSLPVCARFMADLPNEVQILIFKHAVCITSSSGKDFCIYSVTVTDLTTILFTLLIATIVFNKSELCLMWGGSIGCNKVVSGTVGLWSQNSWSCSSTMAHKHLPMFSFWKGKAVFTRLPTSLADITSTTTFTLSKKYILLFQCN